MALAVSFTLHCKAPILCAAQQSNVKHGNTRSLNVRPLDIAAAPGQPAKQLRGTVHCKFFMAMRRQGFPGVSDQSK
jgi:hypothetical protein